MHILHNSSNKVISAPFSLLLGLLVVGFSGLSIFVGIARAGNAGSTACPNERSPGFRAYLPDCRAYELVTPAYKEAQSPATDGTSEELGEYGPRFLVRDFGSFSGVEDQTGLGALYELERTTSEGWRSHPLDAPFATFPLFTVEAISPDFTRSLWVARAPGNSETEDFYLRTPGGSFTPIGPGEPSSANERFAIFTGASEDLSHILFQTFAPRVWPGDTSLRTSLDEYVGTYNSEPDLVGVSNVGPVESVGESRLISACGTFLGSTQGDSYNAISQDGSTVFFTAAACGAQLPATELFARIDNGQRDAHTVAISEPSSTDCGACVTSSPVEALFRGASLDGSHIFFETAQRLLPEAEGAGPFLYEYDFDAPEHGRVTLVSTGDVAGPRVQGVARVSEDGSHVYFVAQGVLTGTEKNIYGVLPEAGGDNLYVYAHDPQFPAGRLSFVATLAPFVSPSDLGDSADWAGNDIRPVQVTSDGQFLVFQSRADLTPDEEGREEAGQIFEYDAETGTLVRVSRGENGYNEDGNTREYQASIPITTSRFQHLALSANGSYVFFTSEDGLTSRALTGSLNVYEYHAGRVALISGGHDLSVVEGGPGVELLGTDASGNDVFFATTEQLVPQDTDTQRDFYDARIGGGLPPPPVQAPCSGDSCQGAAGSPPPLLTPGAAYVANETSSSTVIPPAHVKPKAKAKRKKPKKAHKRRKAGRTTRGRR